MQTWLIPLATALLGAFLAYLPAARRISGRIETSEAREIWEEASKLRDEYRESIVDLRTRLAQCETRFQEAQAELEATRKAYREEIQVLMARIHEAER